MIGSNHLAHNSAMLEEDLHRMREGDKPALYDDFFNPAAAQAKHAHGKQQYRLAQALGSSATPEMLAQADGTITTVDASFVAKSLRHRGGRDAYQEVGMSRIFGARRRPLPAGIRSALNPDSSMYVSASGAEFGPFLGQSVSVVSRVGGAPVYSMQ
jgi:hypothetical protein